jgi:hypothetical protein
MPGCLARVVVSEPLAPVVCAACAFWQLHGRQTTLYKPMGVPATDLYYIDPEEDPLMPQAPTITIRLEDATEIVSQRVRCVGSPPVSDVRRHAVFAFIAVTPRAPLGVR